MIYAIIAAGGTGSRFGAGIPKQFYELEGEAIILKTVKKFLAVKEIDIIIIASHPDFVEKSKAIFAGYKNVFVTPGGENRNDSLINAIDYIENNFGLNEEDIAVTHDAVRPFVSEKVISDSISKAVETGAAVAAVPCVDTVIEVKDGVVAAVPDRSALMRVQTPQTFRAVEFRRIYLGLSGEKKAALTDCSGVLLAGGVKVAVTEGDSENIKITYSSDV